MKIPDKPHRTRGSAGLCWVGGWFDHDFLVEQLLVGFFGADELKRIRDCSRSLIHAGDDVGATEPVCFGQIGG